MDSMPDWLGAPLADAHVIVPLLCGAALVAWMLGRRLNEGVSLSGLFLDEPFLKTVVYTGALLAIYFSCIHFYGVLAAG